MSLSHSSESTNLEKSTDPSTDLSTISENRMDPHQSFAIDERESGTSGNWFDPNQSAHELDQ